MAKDPIWRPDPRRDVDVEFTFHLDARIEALKRAGKSDAEARREALARFGDVNAARQTYIELATRRSKREAFVTYIHSWFADAAYALRAFRRAPAFALGVVLVAGLGIAINSTVFAALNAFFLRPLPVPNADEIVRVYTSQSGNGALYGASSYPDYLDMRDVPALRGLAAYVPLGSNVRVDGELVRAEARLVSDNFFEVLGVAATAGRVFTSRDAALADSVPLVLGHAFWRREFGSDPTVVGRQIEINGANAVVLGVVARTFAGIDPSQVDVYVPVAAQRTIAPGFGFAWERGARLVRMIGRLAPGADLARATSDLNLVMGSLANAYPDTNAERRVSVTRGSALVDLTASPMPIGPIVAMLFSITGVLLLIATVNVAGLLLARTVSRRRELAVRLSLGASRGRILRQLVTESLVLGLAGEIVALMLLAALPALARALSIPETVQLGLDLRVLGFASAITLATALGFSVVPAFRGSSKHPYDGLREGATTMPLRRAPGQRAMVVVQVALSIVLLSTAVLLGQGLRRQYTVDPGFDTTHVLALEFESEQGMPTRDEERAFANDALARVRQLPGVTSATITTSPPLTSEGTRMSVDIPGFQPPPEGLEIRFIDVGTDYCATLGLRIIEGEELRSGGGAGGARRAVLVNETMARTFWPGRSALGATVTLGGPGGPPLRVIGVVADARMVALSLPPGPYFYVQADAAGGHALLVRTATTTAPLKPVLQRVFSSGAQRFLLRRARSMEEVMGASLTEAKAFAMMTAAISVLALILAASALYALVSYLAAQRTREFGIRLALGATRRDVVRLVLSSGTRLAAIGVIVGLLLTFAVAVAMQALLPGLSAVDVASVVAVAAVAAVVATAACAIPAARASALLPANTLRAE